VILRSRSSRLIVQNDIDNRYSQVTIVAAITSKLSPVPYPVEVLVAPGKGNGLSVPSGIVLIKPDLFC
jgi:mRNA-degrading endonuclease toxin of MazEF toxin-antitoxin module